MIHADDLSLAEQISLLSGSDFWHTQPLTDRDVPAVLLSDGPHGLRVQADGSDHLGLGGSVPATCFPPAVTLASSWDEALAEEVGRAVALEALAQGVSVVLGPGLNIKRHPLCGRNFEYLSEDPLLSGRLAAAIVHGVQSRGVGSCLKHFAVNNQEAHRFVVDAVVDERTLREVYLAGFEHAVVNARPWAVMAAYNLVNGAHCSDHRRLLTRILRQEWGFDGLVMSDWGATNDRAAGVNAGMDLEMPGSGG
ncbi:MAG: glycoside hydrolase family 3 N-terminal domain-containing protein, partial [Actinomycetes bacterium]